MTTSESSHQAIFYFDVISPWACIQGDPGLDSPAMQAAANVRFGAARLDGLLLIEYFRWPWRHYAIRIFQRDSTAHILTPSYNQPAWIIAS